MTVASPLYISQIETCMTLSCFKKLKLVIRREKFHYTVIEEKSSQTALVEFHTKILPTVPKLYV